MLTLIGTIARCKEERKCGGRIRLTDFGRWSETRTAEGTSDHE